MAPPSVRRRLELRRKDIDRLGHLNHAAYNDLFYEARVALLDLTWPQSAQVVLARLEIDYLREVRHADGHVDIVARVADIGTKSITIEHEMQLPNGTVAARCRTVAVAWDVATRRSRPLGADERRALLGA